MDYEEETRLKADRVKTCLNRLAGEKLDEVPILAAPDCRGYRNKAQYPVASKRGGCMPDSSGRGRMRWWKIPAV